MQLLVQNTEHNVFAHKEEHSPVKTTLITGICHLNFSESEKITLEEALK